MKTKIRRQGKAWLLATAKAVAEKLKQQSEGTRLRIRIPARTSMDYTDGWYAVIGDLGRDSPRLEIWFDRFSGYPERKLYAGFYSNDRRRMAITKRVSRKLWPVRVVTLKDIGDGQFSVLAQRLKRSEFNMPILEKYPEGKTFFGIFDPTREATERLSPHFISQAVAFFEEVARALPLATPGDKHRDDFPKRENRKLVESHLKLEQRRNSLLATDRKIRDKYQCQVCKMRFEDVYGKDLGREYAEAHHVVPLSQLRDNVMTRINDLRTVCANCHRMLHRMNGERGDIAKLRTIYRRNRGRRTE